MTIKTCNHLTSLGHFCSQEVCVIGVDRTAKSVRHYTKPGNKYSRDIEGKTSSGIIVALFPSIRGDKCYYHQKVVDGRCDGILR